VSTAERIFEKAKALPATLQMEALHYVDFLLSRKDAQAESSEWATASAAQLEKHYSPLDAIYDQD